MLGLLTGLACAATAAEKIDVRSDSAKYSADGKRAEFNGNVVVTADATKVYAERLVVSILAAGNHYLATGAPVVVECLTCLQSPLRLRAPQITMRDDEQALFVSGGIDMCVGADEKCAQGRFAAVHAQWQRAAGIVHLTGAPVSGFWQPPEDGKPITIRAGRVEYHFASGEIAMYNNARLARGADEIVGEAITFNIKTGALTADGGGTGRVRGVFGADE